MKQLVIISLLLLASCKSRPQIEEPRITFSPPPAQLMIAPPEDLKTIESPENG